ncbi:MAG: cytochrome c maturation protein CcmE [Phycisphaerae bacterium]
MRVKLFLAAAALLPAVGLLGYAGMREARIYYLEVDRFLAEPRFQQMRVRLCGTVGGQNLDRVPAEMTVRFDLLGRQHSLPVTYRGAVPDLFKAGAEVVVQGRLGDDRRFTATDLMTKCASKYRPDDYQPASEPSS